MWIVAILFAVAALPAFIFLRERAQPDTETAITGAMQQWIRSFAKLPAFPDFRRLLWCILFYQAGIYVVIMLAGIYAQEVMGFDNTERIVLILAVNVTAAAGRPWIRLFARSHRPPHGARSHPRRVDDHDPDIGGDDIEAGVLGRREHCRTLHGSQPVRGTCIGRLART